MVLEEVGVGDKVLGHMWHTNTPMQAQPQGCNENIYS
jgi:hypothetical protein